MNTLPFHAISNVWRVRDTPVNEESHSSFRQSFIVQERKPQALWPTCRYMDRRQAGMEKMAICVLRIQIETLPWNEWLIFRLRPRHEIPNLV